MLVSYRPLADHDSAQSWIPLAQSSLRQQLTALLTSLQRIHPATQQKMQRFVLSALLSTAAALLAPVTPSRRTVRLHGFFDDMMDKFVVADTDESKQQAPPEPEKDERDVAEKLFGFFFGEVEDAPMGLTRMNVDTQPDQYTAETSGNRNEPVAGDDADLKAWVRPVLLQTMLASLPMYEVYDSNQDGWTPQAFHDAVDRRGPGVVLATSTDGQKFGGYNSKGWVGLGENRAGLSNFLFAWRRDGGFDKLPKVGGAGMGVVAGGADVCILGGRGDGVLVVSLLLFRAGRQARDGPLLRARGPHHPTVLEESEAGEM